MTTIQIKEMVQTFNSETKEICSTNRYMQTYIDSVKNDHVDYPEQKTSYFENVVNITVNSDIVNPQ